MIYSQTIKNARKIKRLEPIEELGQKIQDLILAKTPKFLHERILKKLDNLKLDVKYDLTSSEYVNEEHTVYIDINKIGCFDVFLHEIMHAIGTEKINDDINIGLNKRTFTPICDGINLKTNYGYGANEGLNQHFTESFLPSYITPFEVVPCYSFCANIMSSLAGLLGEDKCQDAHFSGKGIDALIKYMEDSFYLNNENRALKFILSLDAYMRVSRTHLAFGISYTPDTKLLLTECYKSLINLALRKAIHENKEILFSDFITTKHLKEETQVYFHKYLQSDLIKYFYNKKEYFLNHKTTGFLGLNEKSMIEYSTQLYKNFIEKKNFDNVVLPEDIKCGEFYNYLLLSCMLYDEKGNVCPIYMSDFARELTICIFKRDTRLVPNKQSELVQMVKDVLASRNSVRCGAEIDDDYIIESTKDASFNLFLIDSSPETYKNILPQIDKTVFRNEKVLQKVFDEVLSSKFEKLNFIKSLPDDIKNGEICEKQVLAIKNSLKNYENNKV